MEHSMKRTKERKRSNGYLKIDKQKHKFEMSVDEILEGVNDDKDVSDY
jgi:hypothetical protein